MYNPMKVPIPRSLVAIFKKAIIVHRKISVSNGSKPLHRYEFGPPKFFSRTFQCFIMFYSTWQISGGGQWRKACRSQKKERKQSEITWTVGTCEKHFYDSERREFVRALWYEQCPKNSFKRLYTLKGLLVLAEKASFSKEFRSEFHSGGGGNTLSKCTAL